MASWEKGCGAVGVERSGRTRLVKLGDGGTRPLIDRTIPRVHLSVGLPREGPQELISRHERDLPRRRRERIFALPIGRPALDGEARPVSKMVRHEYNVLCGRRSIRSRPSRKLMYCGSWPCDGDMTRFHFFHTSKPLRFQVRSTIGTVAKGVCLLVKE